MRQKYWPIPKCINKYWKYTQIFAVTKIKQIHKFFALFKRQMRRCAPPCPLQHHCSPKKLKNKLFAETKCFPSGPNSVCQGHIFFHCAKLRPTDLHYTLLSYNREAATAERRYEKERQSVNYMHTAAFSARTNLFSPLPALPLPLSHPPPINAIRGAGLHLFVPPSHPLRIVTSFWRFQPKSRTASI